MAIAEQEVAEGKIQTAKVGLLKKTIWIHSDPKASASNHSLGVSGTPCTNGIWKSQALDVFQNNGLW